MTPFTTASSRPGCVALASGAWWSGVLVTRHSMSRTYRCGQTTTASSSWATDLNTAAQRRSVSRKARWRGSLDSAEPLPTGLSSLSIDAKSSASTTSFLILDAGNAGSNPAGDAIISLSLRAVTISVTARCPYTAHFLTVQPFDEVPICSWRKMAVPHHHRDRRVPEPRLDDTERDALHHGL